MSVLKFPSPAAFTQSIRMRRSGAPTGTRFLIVEGVSDKKSFQPLFDSKLHYVPARGKDMVLSAYKTLSDEGVSDCLFVVDCDGGTEGEWLGRTGLVISDNRDIDADLLFEAKAFDRVSLEYLSAVAATPEGCAQLGRVLLEYARQITADFGIVLDAARDHNANTRFLDAVVNERRKLRLQDFPEFNLWVENFVPLDAEELFAAAGSILGWNMAEQANILSQVQTGGKKLCRMHQRSRCEKCTPRRYSNGHDLVDVLAIGLSQRCGFHVTEAEFARAVRLASSAESIKHWNVANRIGKWLDVN